LWIPRASRRAPSVGGFPAGAGLLHRWSLERSEHRALDRQHGLAAGAAAGHDDAARGAGQLLDRAQYRLPAGGQHLERGAPEPCAACVVGEAGRALAQAGEVPQRQAARPGRHGERLGVELIRVLDPQEPPDALQGEPRLQRAEQRQAVRKRMPADGHTAGNGPQAPLGGQRRLDRAHERLGGAAGVEHVAVADRAGTDGGAEVVVSRHGENGAARPLEAPRHTTGRGTGRCRRGQQASRRVRPLERLGPRGAAVELEHAGARGEREIAHLIPTEAAHDPLGDVQPAHAALAAVVVGAQPAVFGERAERARGQARRRRETPPADVTFERVGLLRPALVVPGDGGVAVRVEERAGLGHARHSQGVDAARRRPLERPLRRAQGGLHEPLRLDLGAGRHPPPRSEDAAVGASRSVAVHDGRLAVRRAYVDADQEAGHHALVSGGRQRRTSSSPSSEPTPAA
jgi:hypothetical protein